MLLTTINESDPIYQRCEEAVNKYIETLDESYLISFCEDKDDDDMKVLSHNAPDDPDVFAMIKKDAGNLSSNPFTARKMVMDMPGDFISRSQAIGIHQPQKKMMASSAFWDHPTTTKAIKYTTRGILGAGALAGLKSIYDYENKPVGVISKKIASLRKVLAKLKKKISGGGILPKEKNILQKVGVKITEAIDKLLKFAQKASNHFSREFSK